MNFKYEMARNHLDAKFKKLGALSIFIPPQKGWIRAIRDALGITQMQMAKRMKVSYARISAIEKDEVLGNIKLNTLERAANALGCQLVYTIVPKEELGTIIYNQAKEKAKVLLKTTEHSMKLENQSSLKEDDSKQLEELIQELLKGSQARLWDDY